LYPLNASFSANVTSGESQVAVSFTDATDNGTATNWSWTFGELGTSYDQNPTFNFDTTGTHRVTLNASNEYSYDVYTVDISVDVQNITSSSFIEMVSGVSGKYTSIDLESDGSPHISWVDGSTYTLYRSRLVGDDLMHVWSLTGYDAGNALSWTTIDLDQNDNAHIGYSDYELSAEEDLKEIFINSSGSYITTLGLTNGLYNEGSSPYQRSLKTDAFNYSHIAYEHNGDLYYTFQNDTGWYNETAYTGDYARWASLDLDALGYPHISHYDAGVGYLYYTFKNSSGWYTELVDSGNRGLYSSIRLDSLGYPHISYYDDTNDDLIYTSRNNTAWTYKTVDSTGNVGRYVSLDLDLSGYPHISYYDDTNDDLKYAFQNSTGWYRSILDSNQNVGLYTSIKTRDEGTAHISYYNSTGDDLKYARVTYLIAPIASFSVVDDTDGCAPFTVYFIDSSTGSPTAWSWDLNGDDIEDNTTQNAEYTYSSAGTYTVTLYVSNDCGGDWENKTSYITVGESPVSNFSADDTDGCAPFHVTFTDSSTGSPTAWSWDLNGDDIEDNTTQNAEYTYSSAGTYTVTLYVSNDCGNDWENKTSYITVGESPVASFDANITNGCAPLAVMFNSTSTGTEPLIYAWYINGDYYETQNTSYLFAVGTFNVQLNVSNSCGYDWENKTGYITATSAPTAAFTVNDTDGDKPLAVMFTDESTGLPSSWYWDFGDESTSEEQNPEHTYTIAGVYNVSLKATNTCGSDWENKTSYITVNEGCVPPVSSFGADSTNGTSPFHVTFTDSSTGSPTAWSWDLNGDDIEDNTTQNAEYTYSSAGTYTVTLYVSNDCGNDWENKTSYITVGDAPSCGFDANITNGDKPLVVLFTSSSTGTEPMTYYWDVDGDDSFDYYTRNVTHQYDNSGLYTVKQMVLNGYGECWNNKTDYINVTEGCVSPVAIFSANNTIGTIPFHVVFTDSSTGSPTAWSWDLNGDDIEDNTTQNAEYTYDIAGIYTVKLNVSNDCGYSWENKTGYIIVSEPTPPPTPTPAGYGLYQISTDRGESWIRWDWIIPDEKYGNATTISVLLDGVERYNMSMLIASEISTSYTASGLNPDELHTLELIEHTDGNLTNATVLSKGSLSEMTTHSIWYYLFFLIVAIIFSIIGAFAFDKIKSVVFSSCSLIISLYLSVSTLDNNIIVSSISVIILIVSGVIIIYSLSEIYNKTNGWDR
jgi:PKD repeat protein